MIVQESNVLLSALDRRLQVERLLPVDPLAAVARSPDASTRSGTGPTGAMPTLDATGATATAPSAAVAGLIAQLPLGKVVGARVVEVAQADHVIAEVGTLRVALALPSHGVPPQPGGVLQLRVLAHEPMLVFESVVEGDPGFDAASESTRLSGDALRLQAGGAAPIGNRSAGPVRFDVPILAVEVEVLRPGPTADQTVPSRAEGVAVRPLPRTAAVADGAVPSHSDFRPARALPFTAGMPDDAVRSFVEHEIVYAAPLTAAMADDAAPSPAERRAARTVPYAGGLVDNAVPMPAERSAASVMAASAALAQALVAYPAAAELGTAETNRVALGDAIVPRSTVVVDGIVTPLAPHGADDGPQVASPFMPLVLQGPAWLGQPMELVVRRERADEQFDNPVLDQWCGELLIDLPHLGRVAGHVTLSLHGLTIRLEGDDDIGVETMNAASVELADAFASANLRVSALSVGRQEADAMRSATDATGTATTTFTRQRNG